jgi:hypothetical protein
LRKFILIILTGMALVLAVPEFATATPLRTSGGLATAVEQMGGPEEVRHRRWHHHRHDRVHRDRYRHHYRHRCRHRRCWSGRRW